MENNFQTTDFIKTSNFICVQNAGHITPEDLMLIGSSTKRDAVGKIGFFGSGWKYALAVLMKHGAKPIIFSGNEQINIGIEIVDHRGIDAEVITINGQRTSLTTGMGPKWLMWQAFREIFSNAIDEGNHHIYGSNNPYGTDGVTRVYIPNIPAIKDVMDNFDTYFTFQLEPDFTDKDGTKLFIWDKKQPDTFHFRKGIRCYENIGKASNYSIDFAEININEQRIADSWWVRNKSKEFFDNVTDPKIARWMFLNVDDSYMAHELNDTFRKVIREMQDDEDFRFVTSGIKRVFGDLFLTVSKVVVINDKLHSQCVKENLINKSKFGNGDFPFLSSKMTGLEIDIENHLKKSGINPEVQIGKMEDSINIKRKDGTLNIYLNVDKVDEFSSRCFNMGISATLAAYILQNMDQDESLPLIGNLLLNVQDENEEYVMVPKDKWESMKRLFS
jgi:hypothetical protein